MPRDRCEPCVERNNSAIDTLFSDPRCAALLDLLFSIRSQCAHRFENRRAHDVEPAIVPAGGIDQFTDHFGVFGNEVLLFLVTV